MQNIKYTIAKPRLRSDVVAERSYPTPKVRDGGREEQPHIQGVVAVWAQEGRGSYSTSKVRRGVCEEIPLVQGKEQQLRFAGAAMKRYPTSKVRETHVLKICSFFFLN